MQSSLRRLIRVLQLGLLVFSLFQALQGLLGSAVVVTIAVLLVEALVRYRVRSAPLTPDLLQEQLKQWTLTLEQKSREGLDGLRRPLEQTGSQLQELRDQLARQQQLIETLQERTARADQLSRQVETLEARIGQLHRSLLATIEQDRRTVEDRIQAALARYREALNALESERARLNQDWLEQTRTELAAQLQQLLQDASGEPGTPSLTQQALDAQLQRWAREQAAALEVQLRILQQSQEQAEQGLVTLRDQLAQQQQLLDSLPPSVSAADLAGFRTDVDQRYERFTRAWSEERQELDRRLERQEQLLTQLEQLWQQLQSSGTLAPAAPPAPAPVTEPAVGEPEVVDQLWEELWQASAVAEDTETEEESPADAEEDSEAAPEAPGRVWDAQQLAVIQAPASQRQVVTAGPGTGKTAVAVERVCHLILDQGIPPRRIWLLSFTQVAVREMRQRISESLSRHQIPNTVQIATLDSLAWQLIRAFHPSNQPKLGSYDENIQQVINALQGLPGELYEGIRRVISQEISHLIVDEAQDLVDERAKAVKLLIQHLNPEAGVTIFGDDAQAIYGFASDGQGCSPVLASQGFMASHRNLNAFQALPLSRVYRTDSALLRRLFADGHQLVMQAQADDTRDADALECYRQLRQLVCDCSTHLDPDEIRDRLTSGLVADSVLLYRNRAQILQQAIYSVQTKQKFSLRLSGHPTLIHPWVSLLFWDFPGTHMPEVQFRQRWQQRLSKPAIGSLTLDQAWQYLVAVAGDEGPQSDRIEVMTLRRVLDQRHPPTPFCLSATGGGGAILSTIHSFKGREADHVYLGLSQKLPSAKDAREECKVLFVAASRARQGLYTFERPDAGQRNTRSGRATIPAGGGVQSYVELGREVDYRADLLAGRDLFTTAAAVEEAQAYLRQRLRRRMRLRLKIQPIQDNLYRVLAGPEKQLVAHTAPAFRSDLWELANKVNGFPEKVIQTDVWAVGTCSIVLGPENPLLSTLHSPYSERGFLLAPVLLGLPLVNLKQLN